MSGGEGGWRSNTRVYAALLCEHGTRRSSGQARCVASAPWYERSVRRHSAPVATPRPPRKPQQRRQHVNRTITHPNRQHGDILKLGSREHRRVPTASQPRTCQVLAYLTNMVQPLGPLDRCSKLCAVNDHVTVAAPTQPRQNRTCSACLY